MAGELALGCRAKRGDERCAESKPEANPQPDVAEHRAKRDAQCEAQVGPDGQAAPGLFILVFRLFRAWFLFLSSFILFPLLGQIYTRLAKRYSALRMRWMNRSKSGWAGWAIWPWL